MLPIKLIHDRWINAYATTAVDLLSSLAPTSMRRSILSRVSPTLMLCRTCQRFEGGAAFGDQVDGGRLGSGSGRELGADPFVVVIEREPRPRRPTTVAATRPHVPSPHSILPTSCSSAPAISARVASGRAGDEAPGDLGRVAPVLVAHLPPQRDLAWQQLRLRPLLLGRIGRRASTASRRTAPPGGAAG